MEKWEKSRNGLDRPPLGYFEPGERLWKTLRCLVDIFFSTEGALEIHRICTGFPHVFHRELERKDLTLDRLDRSFELFVFFDHLLYDPYGVHDGRMIFAPKNLADFG